MGVFCLEGRKRKEGRCLIFIKENNSLVGNSNGGCHTIHERTAYFGLIRRIAGSKAQLRAEPGWSSDVHQYSKGAKSTVLVNRGDQ